VRSNKGFFILGACFFILFICVTKSYSYTINAYAEPGGTISPSGLVTVDPGSDQTFTITPEPGYEIFDVITNSGSVGAVFSYTFTNVTADDTITASFYECAKVLLDWNGGYFFDTVMDAYNYADLVFLTDITLKLVGGTLFEEDLYFDKNISVLLDGGYDCSFQNKYMSTGMPGSLRIGAGSVTVANLGVGAGPGCLPGDPDNFPGIPGHKICYGSGKRIVIQRICC